jgi:hypothetical protein
LSRVATFYGWLSIEELAQRFRGTLVSDGLGVIPLRGFPKIHTVTRYLKALVRTEDPFYVLGTRHMDDPETERMAILISEHLCEHHRSERLKGLTERIICTKVSQPADVNVGVHVGPPGEKQESSTGSIVPVDHRTVWSQLLSFEIFSKYLLEVISLRLIERQPITVLG